MAGGDADKLRAYLGCLLRSDQLDASQKGILIHALGDAYAHSYVDRYQTLGSPKESRPNPHYGHEVLFAPPFGHFFSGHSPDYIANFPDKYGRYVDQLFDTLTALNAGATPHPDWIATLKAKAGDISKPGVLDFILEGQNEVEVNALLRLPGGYQESSHYGAYNPDTPAHSVLPDKSRTSEFRDDLIEKIKNGLQDCCPKK